MLRLSRMTDYGVVIMAEMAANRAAVRTASDIAQAIGLPMPTVSKILKMLSQGGLVIAHRGVNGGYAMTRGAEEITAADIIAALDGPVALTACVEGADGCCKVEALCPMRGRWDKINSAIQRALSDVTLAEMVEPVPSFFGPDGVPEKRRGETAGRPSVCEPAVDL